MRRISLALALVSAVAVTGCGGAYQPQASGDGKGSYGVNFTVTVNNQGPGTVSDGTNTCAAPVTPAKSTFCTWTYDSGSTVVLTGTPSATNYFNGFFGSCSGYSCTLDGDADQYVVAYFSANPEVHPNFNDPNVHGPAWTAYALDCKACHGPNAGQGEPYALNKGQGLAVGCGSCHGTPTANVAPVERCSRCHLNGANHTLAEQLGVKVTPGAVTVSGGNVVVAFNVTVNGVPRNDFVNKASVIRNHNEDAYWVYDATQRAGVRTKLTLGNYTLASNGNGNYTATLTGLAATPPAAGTKYMFSVMNGTPTPGVAATYGTTATVVATYGAPTHDVVGDRACVNCHGQLIWREAVHDVTYPQGIGPCIVCHNRTGSADPRLPGAGTGLMGIVHGIHNSKNMPDQQYTFTWASNGNKFNFSFGFPGNMDNCATCHDTASRLDAVKDADVSYALCVSCHDGFTAFPAAPADHLAFTATSGETCTASACHDGAARPKTVSGYHNGLITERAGLIWDGADQSVVLGPTIKLDITGVSVSASNVVVTWTAKNASGVPYDPCNQDFAKGPVFFGYAPAGVTSEGCTNTPTGCSSNMSLLRAYAQGDDWVNPAYPGSTSPGQPRSTNLSATNTTCANGVATSTLPSQAVPATRGIVTLQGKPQVKWAPTGNVIWVRSQTPTREFAVATGALPATQRRQLVDVNKCNACHLGTLYQHGGSRVDKIEMCVMCHNPSSSEQNNRVGMGVTAATAYDGKAGQTYDLRTLVHAVHSAGETKVPLMFYRSNGIYFFGAKDPATGALLGVANWPNEADCVKCVDNEDGPLTWCKVYGSSATGLDYTNARNADGTCKADGELPNSTSGTWRPHRVIEVHYPRPIQDCAACHFTSNPGFADPTKAAAVTVDAGTAPWNNLVDDSLVGPNVTACFTCHQSADPTAQTALQTHAYDNSWTPQVFTNGRQELLNWATCGFATCP